jgi:hypothetical protein
MEHPFTRRKSNGQAQHQHEDGAGPDDPRDAYDEDHRIRTARARRDRRRHRGEVDEAEARPLVHTVLKRGAHKAFLFLSQLLHRMG